jgi:hypothetical protein
MNERKDVPSGSDPSDVASGFSRTSSRANPAKAGFHEKAAIVTVILPAHLQPLAGVSGDVVVEVPPPVTQRSLLDALEAKHPTLRGTTRDHATRRRRAFIRFFACGEDLSNESPDAPLPDAVAEGKEPFVVLGAIAGGEG